MLQTFTASIFFVRLPFRWLVEVPVACSKNIASHWALVGWLTAGLSVLVLHATSLTLSSSVTISCAMITQLPTTGCLHEGGLVDFFDGFDGGTSRGRILTVMKGSHIGSYEVIGLTSYFGLFYLLVSSFPIEPVGRAVLAGDPFCKGASSMIINRLPYARKEEEAENKTVYSRMTS